MRSDLNLIFGPYRLKVGMGLWRHDNEIRLPPKEMALLELLAENRGDVVEHEVIYKYLWPRQVVSYASLARCVYSLRSALHPEGKELIVTVPKRGYKLAVPVKGSAKQDQLSAIEKTTQTKPLAYAHFQAGMACANNPQAGSLERALHWFEMSARVDPDFAASHSAQAEVCMYQALRGFIHPKDALRKGLDSCNAALRIDPDIVQALSLRGWFEALQGGNLKQGMESVEQARQLDPKYSRTHIYKAWIHRAQGHPEEALKCTAKAIELDPHALLNRHSHAFGLFLAGKYAEALKQEEWVLENHPRDDIAHGFRSIFLASLGRHKEALSSAYLCLDLAQHAPENWGAMAWCLAVCGETEEAQQLAKEAYAARLPRCPRPWIAPALVALGEPDQAFTLLREAREEKCPWFPGSRLDPRLAVLQEDERWQYLYI